MKELAIYSEVSDMAKKEQALRTIVAYLTYSGMIARGDDGNLTSGTMPAASIAATGALTTAAPGLKDSRAEAIANVRLQSEQVSQWQAVWDEIYREEVSTLNPAFNIVGWNSSYTGAPIPAEEMKEWVERTVERILSLGARRVLEIGCGTGNHAGPAWPSSTGSIRKPPG